MGAGLRLSARVCRVMVLARSKKKRRRKSLGRLKEEKVWCFEEKAVNILTMFQDLELIELLSVALFAAAVRLRAADDESDLIRGSTSCNSLSSS